MNYWVMAAEIIGIILLVACSAFFSSSEMALFSLPRAKILACAADPDPVRRRIAFLMGNYNRTLITIILSNMFVNSCISMLNDSLIKHSALTGIAQAVLSALIAILILLLFGEITPMTLAYAHSEKWSMIAATPIYLLRKLLTPVTVVVERFTGFILDLLGRGKSKPLTREEYETYLDKCTERGAFSGKETDFLNEALDFCCMDVAEIMIPRNKLAFLRKTDPAKTVAETIRETKSAYVLVGTEKPDDADHILSARDFFALPPGERDGWSRSNALFPADFIPENISIMLAVRKMKKNGKQACLVSDEYGGVAGMAALIGIISRLTSQTLLFSKVAENQPEKLENGWVFNGMMPMDIVEDICGFDLSGMETDVNTLNGFFCALTGSVPETGAEAEFRGLKLTVLEMKGLIASKISIVPVREQ